jgi:DNA replication ATP-dependent helicase Dna2
VREFAVLAGQQKDSPEAVERSWRDPPVVATTCLGVAHPVFSQRTFDYCIVDEASQITLPVCLGPIRMAKTFVLVGDHFQLPPLVQDREAREGGLDVSLFRKLSEEHPSAIVSLGLQYRMCADVMSVANRLVYNGRLRCGNAAVEERKLALPTVGRALASVGAAAGLAARVLDAASCVLFLNTDGLGAGALDVAAGPRITNPLEARLTARLVTLLLSAGLAPADLGIVTFYRSQLALLRQSLHRGPERDVELHTADRFQGRDKEAVLVSFVRSNAGGVVGDLLRDWRRVNVAVTRARSKLVMLGSARTLAAGGGEGEGAEVLRSLVALCRERGWMVDLRLAEVDALCGPEWATQAGSTGASGEVGGKAEVDQWTGLKRPGRVCRVGEKAVVGNRPVLKDILNDVT